MPSLSRLGKYTLAGGAALALGGLVGGVSPVVGAGSGMLIAVAVAWAATVPLPRRMRRERLEFTWWLTARGARDRRPDERIVVRVTLRNATASEVVLATPRLALSPGLRHARIQRARVVVPPRSMAAFDLEVRAQHAGRHVLHGAWMTLSGPLGLAWAPLYFPNPLVVQVGTRAMGVGARVRAPTRMDPAARAGRAVRRAGEGPEVRELRDHQPGDPFRRIAWKASARKGRMLVRETEDEGQATRVLVIDASATMRGHEGRRSKIDYAIELAAQAAKISLATGDRLGLVAFDSRVVCVVPPDHGAGHARALVASALELRSLVDEDLTDVADEAVVQTVARYFREQEGIDLLAHGGGRDAWQRLSERAARTARHDPAMRLAVRARDPLLRVLRAFCRARSLNLPLRHDASGSAKLRGLTEALREAIAAARERRTLLVVSDLDPIDDAAALRTAFSAARSARHRVTVVAPAGADFAIPQVPLSSRASSPMDDVVGAAVRDLFTRDEAVRLRDLRPVLATVGVSLHTATARDPAAHWLRRAAAPAMRTR